MTKKFVIACSNVKQIRTISRGLAFMFKCRLSLGLHDMLKGVSDDQNFGNTIYIYHNESYNEIWFCQELCRSWGMRVLTYEQMCDV